MLTAWLLDEGFTILSIITAILAICWLIRSERLSKKVEQYQVQLAGCSVAALGGSPKAERGDYGWSPAYQDVLDLREEVERLRVTLVTVAERADAYVTCDRGCADCDLLRGLCDMARGERGGGGVDR